jgi:hypothetical protein
MEMPAELVPRCRETGFGVRKKRGSFLAAYLKSPPGVRVICIDELGPLVAKTYAGEEWKLGSNRATFEPDYGRRCKLWVHGAFEPATGQATRLMSPGRDSDSHIQLLEKVMREFPAERWLIIEDNLIIHASREVKLALTA